MSLTSNLFVPNPEVVAPPNVDGGLFKPKPNAEGWAIPVVPVAAGPLISPNPFGTGAGGAVPLPNAPPAGWIPNPVAAGRANIEAVPWPNPPVTGGLVAGVLDTPNAEGVDCGVDGVA